MSIPYLLSQLQKSSVFDQLYLVKAYVRTNNKDWKSFIKYNNGFNNYTNPMSTELWNSKYSKLVLKGWNKQEDEELYSFGMIHTFVLDGSVQIYNSKNEKHSLLLPCAPVFIK